MKEDALHDLIYAEVEGRQRAHFRTSTWWLFKSYWTSSDALVSALLAVFVIGTGFVGVYFSLRINQWTGKFYDAIGAGRFSTIPSLLMLFLLIIMVAATVTISAAVASDVLKLRWRTWLTNTLIDKWTRSGAYFRIERDKLLDNADQRISEDVKLFVDYTVTIISNLTHIPVSAVTFSIVLWELSGSYVLKLSNFVITIPGYMLIAVYLYSVITLLLTHLLGRSLIPINIRQQKVEADFRTLMVQIREGAEQIAFYDGAAVEASRLRATFSSIRANTWRIIRVSSQVMFGVQVPGQIGSILPVLLVLPQLMAGTMTLGALMRVRAAFGSVEGTLSYFPQAYQSFATWRAVVRRLLALLDAMEAQASAFELNVVERTEHTSIEVGALTLTDPQGKELSYIPPFVVKPGARCLIRGRSGAGKSTLLRALAGIWPFGIGTIAVPARTSMMFVPQKSYVPVGTLRQALAYPRDKNEVDDAMAQDILTMVGLEQFLPLLDQPDRWGLRLSGGEQQRLAFARIIIARPDYIFVDEATSALDLEWEHRMYSLLIERLPGSTLISVAHRKEVAVFHDQFVDLTSDAIPASAQNSASNQAKSKE